MNETALSTLEKIAEEIPSGVSSREVGEIVTLLQDPAEITNKINEEIVVELKRKLRELWETYQLNGKLAQLKSLPCSSSTVVKPNLSPEAAINESQLHVIQDQRRSLEAKLKETKKQTAELEKLLREKKAMVYKQISEMKN